MKDVSKKYNVSRKTLKRWDVKGINNKGNNLMSKMHGFH